MSFRLRALLCLTALAAVAACSGGAVTLTPRRAGTPVPKTTPTPVPTMAATATATPSAAATLTAAQVTTALQGVQTYFGTLPQTGSSIDADLQALAKHMVASKTFTSATVGYGGITATLPDGTRTIVFADSPEDFGLVTARATAAELPPSHRATSARRATIGPSTAHELAFLYNDEPNPTPSLIPAFSPTESTAYADAFANLGYTKNGYGADAAPFTLDSLAALRTGHPLDLLQISTHGVVIVQSVSLLGTPTYDLSLLTTTPISSAVDAAYKSELANGTLLRSVRVAFSAFGGGANGALAINPTYSVTPAFLTSHLTFNPGALVDLQACYSANSAIASQVASTLNAADVGTYLGWTKAVAGLDSRQADAFMLDRLLGEQSPSVTGLDQYVAQRTPPQRPFPLSDIATVEQSELRANPGGMGGGPVVTTYAVSELNDPENALAPPLGTTAAVLMVQTLPAGSSTIALPEIYDVPSIARLAEVAPTVTGALGSLDIYGSFPSVQGTVTIADATGTHALPVISWSQTQIVVALPGSGAGSAGQVVATDADGIPSNAVPLTQWQGTLNYNESDAFASVEGVDGSGTGTFGIDLALTFRSDVHPMVPAIDTTPVPQNLYFPQVESTSAATVTTLQGLFTSSEGTPPPDQATFSLGAVTPMQPGPLPLTAGTFIVGGYAGQPAPCNNGTAGYEGDAGNVFCPAFGYKPQMVGVCTPTPSDSDICGFDETFTPGGSFGAAGLTDPGIVAFVMDPATYAISVSNPSTSFMRTYLGNWSASAQVTGTIGAPAYAPSATTTAAVRRGSFARR